MESKHIYTSTGVKFWRHPDQMISFLHGTGKTVISTHISPTGDCNLNCSYCHIAGTNILMSDMSWKNIEDIRKGDIVIGLNENDKYTFSKVINTFSREDECIKLITKTTETISTLSHKWREHGRRYRNASDLKYLRKVTSNNAKLKINNKEFKHGWICGMIEGDGCIFEKEQKQSRNRNGTFIRRHFRLAVKDYEIIDRFCRYVNEIEFKLGLFKSKTGDLYKIESFSKHKLDQIKKYLIHKDTQSFWAGYLSGMFDAEGSYNVSLKISQYPGTSKETIIKAFESLNFKIANEAKGVRLLGGLSEIIRFMNICRPCLKRKTYNFLGTSVWANHEEIIRKEYLGIKQVFNIETKTGNYIANGFISKNCSVSKREKHDQLEVDTIVNYIQTLIQRGLRAVIFTGGGEPTIHPQWNEIVSRLRMFNLKFGLITNGIDLEDYNLEIFDWIRVSVNYPAYYKLMEQQPPGFSLKSNCTIGLSLIYTGSNKQFNLSQLLHMAQRYNAKYIRVLPDCVPEQLSKAHQEIDKWLNDHPNYDTSIFLHQQKYHGTPITNYCPQAYFRPYLSEIDGGTIFPCDSVVLNNPSGKFEKKYALCKADEIGDFLDGKIKQKFDPNKDCKGCVFYENVNMLHDWSKGAHQFHKYTREIKHEDFV